MVPMWVRYTTLHGPTSFDEDGHWLGQGPGFWGSMMAPAMLLIGVFFAIPVASALLPNPPS